MKTKYVNIGRMDHAPKPKIAPLLMEVKKRGIKPKCVQNFKKGNVSMEKHVLSLMVEQTSDEMHNCFEIYQF